MNFGEKKAEYSSKHGREIPVWQSPKYIESKAKAEEIIRSEKYGVKEGDFWILMNATKSDKMAYTGLIISHNGCLKINDCLETKFDPGCVSIDKEGYKGSLVYSYCNPEQGIYEVGEVNTTNCKNEYPYAMAFKRLFDRVVLKLSKLAYAGIYSDSEAEEFAQRLDATEEPTGDDKGDFIPQCAECKTEITVAEHEYSVKKYNKPLCRECQKKAAGASPRPTNNPAPEEIMFRCEECGEVLKPYKDINGVEVSIRKHVAGSKDKFGSCLCIDCIRKAQAIKAVEEMGE